MGKKGAGAVVLAFSPDGKTLATSSGMGLQVWDLTAAESAGAPLDPAWLKRVSALPAKEQLEGGEGRAGEA